MINLIAGIDCKLDTKGRVLLPTALKNQLLSVLSEGFVIKRSIFQKCLELYPRCTWNEQMLQINKLNRFIKKNDDFIRLFMAGVREVELDSVGRLQIPKDLAEYVGLKSDIVLASATDRIEIWDKKSYEATLNAIPDISNLAEEVMGNIDNS